MGVVFDFIGVSGVMLILIAYFLLQRGTVTPHTLRYLYLNLAGAILITISLFHAWNLASFVIEMAWIVISVYGIVKALRKKAKL